MKAVLKVPSVAKEKMNMVEKVLNFPVEANKKAAALIMI